MAEVSVVIATRNRAALVAGAVASVCQQSSDVEVFVVDDASTDETPEVCRKLPGVRYLRLDNQQGTAAARNAGVRESSAEFIAFLDDDDLRLPGTLQSQIQLLKDSPATALVYGRALVADPVRRIPTGQVIPAHCPEGDVFWKLLAGNFIPTSSVVVRRTNFIEAGLFRTDLSGIEDWDIWLRLSERHSFKAVHEAVAIYRGSCQGSGQVSSDYLSMCRIAMSVQETALQSERASTAERSQRERVRRTLRRSSYDVLVYEAARALAIDDKATARSYLQHALRLCPFRLPALSWLVRSLVIGSVAVPLRTQP